MLSSVQWGVHRGKAPLRYTQSSKTGGPRRLKTRSQRQIGSRSGHRAWPSEETAWIPAFAGMTDLVAGLKPASTDSTTGRAEGRSPSAFLHDPPRMGDQGG